MDEHKELPFSPEDNPAATAAVVDLLSVKVASAAAADVASPPDSPPSVDEQHSESEKPFSDPVSPYHPPHTSTVDDEKPAHDPTEEAPASSADEAKLGQDSSHPLSTPGQESAQDTNSNTPKLRRLSVTAVPTSSYSAPISPQADDAKELHESASSPSLMVALSARRSSDGRARVSASNQFSPSDNDGKDDVTFVNGSWVREHKKLHQSWVSGKLTSLERMRAITEQQRNRELSNIKKQISASAELVKRMEIWCSSSKASQAFLLRRKQILLGYVDNSLSHAIPVSAKEVGTMKEYCDASTIWQSILNQSVIRIDCDVFPRMNILIKDLESAYKRLQQVIKNSISEIEGKIDTLNVLWNGYYQVHSEYIRSLEIGTQPKVDSLIIGRKYVIGLENYRALEANFSSSMDNVFAEVQTLDRQRIETLKNIFQDFFQRENDVLKAILQVNEDSQKFASGVDPSKDLHEFLSCGLFFNDPAGKDSVFQAFQCIEEDLEVCHCLTEGMEIDGDLQRPGSLLKSNWHPTYVVVSSSGTLYQFENRKSYEPILSLTLNKEVAVKPEVDQLAFTVTAPDTSFFAFTNRPLQFKFKTSSQEELVRWLSVISKHIKNSPINST
eukprot:TRINITY_DN2638_c1_g1_i2.p1 TRINITY_DN2638_c1_g1~~TRINITY_DN2638_c1_g1_i2.p1  ORF type:complete len:613 (-),score=143.46 TRINITY_DN2638_c1_g1_i2:133-1971(-)